MAILSDYDKVFPPLRAWFARSPVEPLEQLSDLSIDIAEEFSALSVQGWDLVESWARRRYLRKLARLCEVRDWQRTTTWGRERERIAQRARYAKESLETQMAQCHVCGRSFIIKSISVRKGRHRRRTCSGACRLRLAVGRGRPIEIGGITMTLQEWAVARGMDPSTVWYRVKRGMSPEQALSAPLHAYRGKRRRRVAS
jgi:hypothetical protein